MKIDKKISLGTVPGAILGGLLLTAPMVSAADNYEWYYSLDPYTASNQIPELEHYHLPDVAPEVGYAYPKYSGKWDWRKAANRHLKTRQTQASVYIPEVQPPAPVVRYNEPSIPTVKPVVTSNTASIANTAVVQIPWRSRNTSNASADQALPWNDLSAR